MDSAGDNLIACDGLGLRNRVVPRLPIGRRGQSQQQEQAQETELIESGESNNGSPGGEYATPRGLAKYDHDEIEQLLRVQEDLTRTRALREANLELQRQLREVSLQTRATTMAHQPPNNSGPASTLSCRLGLSTMEFQGSSRPSSALRRELHLGSPEGDETTGEQPTII
ncbi:hypothetical protein Emag_007611 [Eimeria magna]